MERALTAAPFCSIRPCKNGPTAVNAIFTPLNEILSVALSCISGRIRLRENAARLMRC